MDLRRLRCCGCNRVERARWIATARTRATFAFRLRRKALDAAIATCAVRYSARDLLSQRRLVESLARCNSRGGRRWCCAEGKAVADRPDASRQAILRRALRGGAGDPSWAGGRGGGWV